MKNRIIQLTNQNGFHIFVQELAQRPNESANGTLYELFFRLAELLLCLSDLDQRRSIDGLSTELKTGVDHIAAKIFQITMTFLPFVQLF